MATLYDLMTKIVLALNVFVRIDDQDLTEEQQEMVRTNINAADQTQVDNIQAEIDYKPIEITSMSITHPTAEMGSVVDSLTIEWMYNKAPTSVFLNDVEVDRNQFSYEFTNVTDDTIYTLYVTDERDAVSSASVGISFINGIYHGVAVDPEVLDSAFILGFTKELSSSKSNTINVTAEENQKIWYAFPARLGVGRFSVGGIEGGFELVDTIDFTNSLGYTEPYYVYASVKTGLGEIKVVVD